MRISLSILLLIIFALPTMPAQAGSHSQDDVLAKINQLPGVTAREIDGVEGVKNIEIFVEQPVDHFDKNSSIFKQRVILNHRSFDEPMVLLTSGYSIFGNRLARLSMMFGTNQLQIEHRFFGTSLPANMDWSKLTVRQSAEDFHHIVQLFKPLYTKNWVNTGKSKGGMTSVFHRRFYPDDVTGTLAEVAPINFTLNDTRYIDFVDNVGGDKYRECREALYKIQESLLKKTDQILPLIDGDFSELGNKQLAFENVTVEMPFVFWQYGSPSDCENLPSENASASELYAFLESANNPKSLANHYFKIFQPYMYQAAVELGTPGAKLSHISHLLKYPYELGPFLPKNVPVPYSNQTMHDIKNWVASNATSIMFVYGEYDPWTSGAFQTAGVDDYVYTSVKGNHSSGFNTLSGDDSSNAIATLSRWIGKEPVTLSAFLSQDTLEDFEWQYLKAIKSKL